MKGVEEIMEKITPGEWLVIIIGVFLFLIQIMILHSIRISREIIMRRLEIFRRTLRSLFGKKFYEAEKELLEVKKKGPEDKNEDYNEEDIDYE